ncbi:SIR2 family protein [Thalassobaculum sp.]|uniref:SIR2 family protein n=1 Tax=Thalassobaculum sp. TaxID=2022740 RepID=UPI0032EFE94B
MWTYRHPFRPLEMTADSIEYHGRIALYRALNIGRVVAFTGAGVSSAYGRPTWDALVVAGVIALGKILEDVAMTDLPNAGLVAQAAELLATVTQTDPDNRSDLKEIAEALSALAPNTTIGDAERKTVVLALTIHVAKAVRPTKKYGAPEAFVRREVAKAIYKDEHKHASDNAPTTSDDEEITYDPDFDKWNDSYSEYRIRKAITGESTTERARKKKENRRDDGVIRTLSALLNIRRFLTLNYDLEIERDLVDRFSLSLSDSGRRLASLIESQLGASLPRDSEQTRDGRRQRAEETRIITEASSIETVARVATIAEETIGEMINFAAHPTRARAQVFHLHGRVDDPTNMVLSEDDYLRQYLRDDLRRRTFHEGLNTLFHGNDILFVGIGMSEQDILRPLRQFVSQERAPDFDSRHVFALMLRSCNERLYEDDVRKDAAKTTSYMVQYGVHVIRFGDLTYWKRRKVIEGIIEYFSKNKISKKELLEFRKIITKDNCPNRDWKLFHTDDMNELIDEFSDRACQILTLGRQGGGAHLEAQGIVEAANLILGRLMTNALNQILHDIAKGQRRWWKDWQRIPAHRKAQFQHNFDSKHQVNNIPLVWMRHKPDYLDHSYTKYQDTAECPARVLGTKVYDYLMSLKKHDYDLFSTGRRVASVTIPRGGGKGSLTHYLSINHKYADIFPFSEDATLSERYIGAFIGHLSFVVEFNSVIEALNGFFTELWGHLVTNKTIKTTPIHLNRHFETIHPLDILRVHLRAAANLKQGGQLKGKRVFILLYGVDRLCNAEGVAMNAAHRAFFRTLTGYGKYRDDEDVPDAPIDILFLTGREGVPVRYTTPILPRHRIARQDRTSDEYRVIGNTGYYERVPPILPAIPLENRDWLRKSLGAEPFEWLSRRFAREIGGWPSKSAPVLCELVSTDVALSAWVFKAFASWDRSDREARLEEAETIASRDGVKGLIGLVLATHGRRRSRATAIRADLILKHLSLFPIPVELLVLYGCPEIRDHLRADTGNGQPKRNKQLGALHEELQELTKQHLVIRIKPRGHAARGVGASPEAAGSMPQSTGEHREMPCADRIHYRYTVHPRIREYMSHRMDFPFPDREDAGLFRVSLYPYQGRERPKASRIHYTLVRDILRYQIERSRNTIWCLYQFDRILKAARAGGEDLSPEKKAELGADWKYLDQGLRRRLTVPSKGSESKKDHAFEDHFASIHAVTQRIRACYSLLRGGFSVGTINQISAEESGPKTDQPMERYHGWLRSLNNLAVSLSELQSTIDALVRDTPGPGGDLESPLIAEGEESAEFLTYLNKHRKLTDWRRGASETVGRWHEVNVLIHWATETSRPGKFKQPPIPSRKTSGSLRDQRVGRAVPFPLYNDELGWMQNERGVLAYAQGNLFDALPLFEGALRIMRHYEQPAQPNPSRHSTERRIKLNRALARIDRGNLNQARADLVELLEELKAPWSSQSITSRLAAGYIGLVDHLCGSRDAALKAYDRILEFAEGEENLRVAAIFHRHKADLLRSAGELDAAKVEALKAESAARQAGQQGMLHQARLSHSKILMTKGEWVRAQGLIQSAHDYAEDLGMPKVMAEALETGADLMYRQGETTLSGETAARAVALATGNGMRLRKISSLEILGNVMIKRGQLEMARDVLREAKLEAERCRYQSRVGSLTNMLADLKDEFEL